MSGKSVMSDKGLAIGQGVTTIDSVDSGHGVTDGRCVMREKGVTFGKGVTTGR